MWDLSLLLGHSGLERGTENFVQVKCDTDQWSHCQLSEQHHENWPGFFKGCLGFQARGRKSPPESQTRLLLSDSSGWWTENCVLSRQAGQ